MAEPGSTDPRGESPPLTALGDLIAEYEAEHGCITDAEIADATRWARERALVVRGDPSASRSAR